MEQGKGHIRALTGLRAVAAWWVVLFHFKAYLAAYLPAAALFVIGQGFLAVDLFFCLSGFVIFLNNGDLRGPRDLRLFYLKRLARIYPLHLLMLLLYAALVAGIVAMHHGLPSGRFALRDFLANLFLAQDWLPGAALTWNVPAWSISAEFAAYLAFPLLAVVIRPREGNWLWLLFLAAIAMAVLNAGFALHGFDLGSAIGSLGVLRCVTQFFLGAIVAAVYRRYPVLFLPGRLLLWSAVGIFAFLGIKVGTSLFMPLAWAGLVYILATGERSNRLLSARWLVFAGEASYATYMCHYLFYDVFKLVLVGKDYSPPLISVLSAFLAIGVASAILYVFVERPSHKWIMRCIPKRAGGMR